MEKYVESALSVNRHAFLNAAPSRENAGVVVCLTGDAENWEASIKEHREIGVVLGSLGETETAYTATIDMTWDF